MTTKDLIAQGFGILGMITLILSFQPRSNKGYFTLQILGSMFFIMNYYLIGAFAGIFMNAGNIFRNVLFMKSDRKVWKLVVSELIYVAFAVVLFVFFVSGTRDTILSFVMILAAIVGGYFLWMGEGKVIRYAQLFIFSPTWIAHNIINFTLGGLLCEIFNSVSSLIAIIRYRKKGFLK